MAFHELIFGTLFEPAATFREIGRNKPLGSAVLLVALIYIFGFLVDMGIAQHSFASLAVLSKLNLNASGRFYWFYAILGFPFTLLIWFFMSAIYSHLGELFWNKANGKGVLTVLAFSLLPGILTPPLQLVGRTLGWGGFSFLVSLGVLVWIAVLQIIGLKETLEIETGNAVTVWIAPLIAVFAIIILSVICLFGMFTTLIK